MADGLQMWNGFEVAAPQMEKAAGYCKETAQYIEGLRKRVDGIRAALVSPGNWQSTAAGQFSAALVTWDEQFRKVIRSLETIHDNLLYNTKNYSAAELEGYAWTGEVAGTPGLSGSADGREGRIDNLINAH